MPQATGGAYSGAPPAGAPYVAQPTGGLLPPQPYVPQTTGGVLPGAYGAAPGPAAAAPGAFPPLPPSELQRYQASFLALDTDRDGFVTVRACRP